MGQQIKTKRIFGLDLLRAIAILIVVSTHGNGISALSMGWIPSIPKVNGVDIFFVLSGFFIGLILLKEISRNKEMDFKSVRKFWQKRLIRTVPAYYLILIVNYILVKKGLAFGNIDAFNFKFFLFAQNFSSYFVDFFWESWSLPVQEFFYLGFPVLLYVLLRYYGPQKAMFISIIVMLVLPLVYRMAISNQHVDYFWWDVKFRKIVLTRLDSIFYGVLAAYVRYFYNDFWVKNKNKMLLIGFCLMYIHLLGVSNVNTFYRKTFYFSFISLGIAMVLPFFDNIKTVKSKHLRGVVTYISNISYGMYLVNLGIVALFIQKQYEINTPTQSFSLYMIYWIVTIALSSMLYFFFEQPLVNWVKKK
ncbi:MAG: acyltransferase family protein [Bacteroidales bacterium]